MVINNAPELCKRETPNIFNHIDAPQEFSMVPFCTQLQYRTPKQVELYSHFGAQRAIPTHRSTLMCGKDAQWIVPKVQH
jgi:hypothetical protein